MTILGKDIAGVEDVDKFLTMTSGPRATAQAVMRSLLHSPGVLWWAPERGYNLWDHVHGFFDQERIERAIQTEAEADERVQSASVSAELLGSEMQLTINLVLTQTQTDVTLTVTIDQLGGILDASIAN